MNIAVLVSGGVDSAVALRLVQEAGHTVTAFYLKIWLEDELSYLGRCPWQEDLKFVEHICKQANVPLQVLSLQKEYHEVVVAYTLAQARLGNTPNPDIFCNTHIKFGFFMDKIEHEFDVVATGHYAQTEINSDGRVSLLLSADVMKDQTYFLSYLTQRQLQKAVFPIGQFTKTKVREHAQRYNLLNKNRKDSQGICFLGTIKFKDFLKHHLGVKKGFFVEYESGKKVGEHEGAWFYTIGQRQGIGLSGGPWYVVAKDIAEHIVYISSCYSKIQKNKNEFLAVSCNWIEQMPPPPGRYAIKLRHGSAYNSAQITIINDCMIEVQLDSEDQGIASGQFVVIYRENRCLGAGIIQHIT
ncbi:MAG TPA: tRNA 2-thiouridine(34) synthase MnmA [Patescibacteria group bacterium]|jgi:tRNA-specific 2-thiouridylase|nr:tRNA 2-thiouridine(34) synthase MnmA [Patescibacteria group bacterium]